MPSFCVRLRASTCCSLSASDVEITKLVPWHERDRYRLSCRVASVSPVRGELGWGWWLSPLVESTRTLPSLALVLTFALALALAHAHALAHAPALALAPALAFAPALALALATRRAPGRCRSRSVWRMFSALPLACRSCVRRVALAFLVAIATYDGSWGNRRCRLARCWSTARWACCYMEGGAGWVVRWGVRYLRHSRD